MQQMDRFFEPETWSLLLLDEERKNLFYAVVVGDAEEELSHIQVKLGEGIAGWVAEHGETLIVPELAMDHASSLPLKDSGRRALVIAIPLRSGARTLGIVQLFNCAGNY